jgi:hypothetical protein
MKKTLMMLMVFTATAAQAKLVEDGSSFNGHYKIQEADCYIQNNSGYGSQQITETDFKGSVEALEAAGFTYEVAPYQSFDHGQGITTSSSGGYLSSTEFQAFSGSTDPYNTPKTQNIETDITIDPSTREITRTTYTYDENSGCAPSKTQVCHYTFLY